MEDSNEETPSEKPTNALPVPVLPEAEPQPDDDVKVPNFLFTMNTGLPTKEEIE